MTPDQLWPIASQLVLHAEDANDHNLPKMIWFGIEPLVPARPAAALQLAAASELPLVTRFIARRLVDDDQVASLVAALDGSPPALRDMLAGLRDGLEGRYDVTAPESWSAIYADLQNSGDAEVRRLSLQTAQHFGDTVAAQRLLDVLNDRNAPADERRQALRSLANQKMGSLKSHLVELLHDEVVRRDAIRAVAAFDDGELFNALFEMYHEFNADEKLDALQALAARTDSGWKLAFAIYEKEIPKKDVPAYVARQLQRVVGNKFVDIWGPLETLPESVAGDFSKYRELLTDEAVRNANPTKGRAVFKRACSACHKLYDEGGAIGPEITGANRANLDYLLGNILTPSADIQDAYRMVLILTDDGRLYSGILAGENEHQVQLRVPGELEPIAVPKSEIVSREIAPVSMMPEGLLKNLPDAEVLDLVAYLRTTKQVPLPDEEL